MIWESLMYQKSPSYTTNEGSFKVPLHEVNNKAFWKTVLTNPTLSSIELPTFPAASQDIIPFIQRFSKQDSSLRSLRVRSPEFSLIRSRDGVARMVYQCGFFHSNSAIGNSFPGGILLLPEIQIENLQKVVIETNNTLTEDRQPNFVRDWLNHPACVVNDLQMNLVGDGVANHFTHYCQQVAQYQKLIKLTLFVEVALPLHKFCPSSPRLHELTLHFGDDLARDWSQLASDLLRQHPSLTILRISPSEVDETAPLADFAAALAQHDSMQELEIGLGLPWRQDDEDRARASNRMLRELAGAFDANPRLRKLKIDWSSITVASFLTAIPKFKSVQELDVSTSYQASSEDVERLARVLRSNLSITDFRLMDTFFDVSDHGAIRQTCVRNKLLQRSNHVGKCLAGMPRSILAPLFAILGSNHGEGSAIYSLLVQESNRFANLLKIRKGKRSRL